MKVNILVQLMLANVMSNISLVLTAEQLFCTSGYLAGTSSKYNMTDGLQGKRFPCGTSIAGPSQPRIALHGRRALHGSRVLSESSKGAFSNRPLSPHLALKKPQLSATYSISHRILGGVVASAIMISPIVMKFSLLCDI